MGGAIFKLGKTVSSSPPLEAAKALLCRGQRRGSQRRGWGGKLVTQRGGLCWSRVGEGRLRHSWPTEP